MKVDIRRRFPGLVLAFIGFVGSTSLAHAEESILQTFIGEWRSNSPAFGQPAQSTAVWTPALGGQFYRLEYAITHTQKADDEPVFAGVAYYQPAEAGGFTAFWADSSGDLHQISASQTERSLEAIWGSAEEKLGRTRYELLDQDRLRITDWISQDGQWRQFNQGEYVRQKTQTTQSEGGRKMEKVAGIGGVFFRAAEASQVAQWYADNLGVDPTPTDYETQPWQQQAGPTVFAPFGQTTDYFGKPEQQWMINFRVKDLDAMVKQLRDNGNDVEVDPEVYPNGRFARTHDPEGTPVELWEPAD
ncbi:MAG: VOC family protein [Pseudomonadales bacterium]